MLLTERSHNIKIWCNVNFRVAIFVNELDNLDILKRPILNLMQKHTSALAKY